MIYIMVNACHVKEAILHNSGLTTLIVEGMQGKSLKKRASIRNCLCGIFTNLGLRKVLRYTVLDNGKKKITEK